MGSDNAEWAKHFTERVFFNSLVILKGVVLAYGATVLIALMRRGAPWGSGQALSIYLAWATTMLLVTLTFVSQALGSSQTSLRPTTGVILLTFILAMTEFIAFGLLEPQPEENLAITVRYWFLGVAGTTATATLFIVTMLWQTRSSRYPEVSDDPKMRSAAHADLLGAGLHSVMAFAMWCVLAIPAARERYSWIAVLTISIGVIFALAQQQRKMDIVSHEGG